MLTFDALEPGTEIGRCTITADEPTLAAWAKALPRQSLGEVLPPAATVALLMRAYALIVTPRPPGNVHAGQALTFGAEARRGEAFVVSVHCAGKAFRNGRRWVNFSASMNRDDTAVIASTLTFLWAR